MRAFFCIGLIATLAACDLKEPPSGEFKHPDQIVNPNGDSELALVMRNMHYEANAIRSSIELGNSPDYDKLHQLVAKITTAEPTDSSQLDENYYQLAEVLQNSAKRMGKGSDPAIEFDNFIGTCISCHRNTCPGPISKIQKLIIAG